VSEIALKGKYAHLSVLIDESDIALVDEHRWFYHLIKNVAYARRTILVGGARRYQYLHTFLTGWALVDHVNHDGLDNRRLNLRQGTQALNCRNKRKAQTMGGRPCSSSFKGVSRTSTAWHAYVNVSGHRRNLGWFKEEVEAALAYDRAAKELHGEWATLNFPDSTP
jgi:hypothetical protein